MRLPAFLLFGVLATMAAARAQVELVSDNYFPAEFEFRELQKFTLEEAFEDPARLSTIDGGRLFLDVGLDKYQRRVYTVGPSGSLSIEVVTLRDSRAAYSLLTLLRNSSLQDGPPGDAFTLTADGIRFAQGKEWVRIQGRGASEDLIKRVANSISNRIGTGRHKPPALISHFPRPGYDASSLRYFPGLKSYESYASGMIAEPLQFNSDMEIAQARYLLENQAGVLSLLNFPTAQVAEEYFSELTGPKGAEKTGTAMYAKKAGPIVAILEGTFDPVSADKILGSIKFSYSIRWIYEKRNKPTTIWGVPVGILGTVVRSLFFMALLCGVSIAAGVGFAVFRFVLRGYAPQNPLDRPERTEITQLRLR
jgi:hypothetical protein